MTAQAARGTKEDPNNTLKLAERVADNASLLSIHALSFSAALGGVDASPERQGQGEEGLSGSDVRSGSDLQAVVRLGFERTSPQDSLLLYRVHYSIDVPGELSATGNVLANIEVRYEAVVELAEVLSSRVTDEELMAYGTTVIASATHSFFREAVHNFTSRLGLAPVTLGLLPTPLLYPEDT
jgi:hypothetical protein